MNIPFKKDGKIAPEWLEQARERLLKAVENADDGCGYLRIHVTLHDVVLDDDLEFASLTDAADYLNITKGRASTAASKGRPVNGYLIIRHGTQSGKAVEQLDMVTGEVIKTYPTIERAASELKINRSNIASCCRCERNSAGCFGWRFVGEKNTNK